MKVHYINEGTFGSYKNKQSKEDKLSKLKKETGDIIRKDFIKKLTDCLIKRNPATQMELGNLENFINDFSIDLIFHGNQHSGIPEYKVSVVNTPVELDDHTLNLNDILIEIPCVINYTKWGTWATIFRQTLEINSKVGNLLSTLERIEQNISASCFVREICDDFFISKDKPHTHYSIRVKLILVHPENIEDKFDKRITIYAGNDLTWGTMDMFFKCFSSFEAGCNVLEIGKPRMIFNSRYKSFFDLISKHIQCRHLCISQLPSDVDDLPDYEKLFFDIDFANVVIGFEGLTLKDARSNIYRSSSPISEKFLRKFFDMSYHDAWVSAVKEGVSQFSKNPFSKQDIRKHDPKNWKITEVTFEANDPKNTAEFKARLKIG